MDEMWFVSVGGQSYGPYPLDRMRAFIAEGRILPQSLVGQPDAESMTPAADDPILAPLFQSESAPASTISQSQEPAHASPSLTAQSPRPTGQTPRKFGQQETENDVSSHVIVITDMKSGSINDMEEAIFNLGEVSPLMPQVWLLTTTRSVTGIRNALTQKLGKLDMLFVVDSTHDKVAWHNFGPEAESRIRRVWARTGEFERKAG